MPQLPWSIFTLSPPLEHPFEEPSAFFHDVCARVDDGSPKSLAVVGGYYADRLGLAFVCGYAAALRCLLPGTVGLSGLAATESGGAHPRAIETTIELKGNAVAVNGTKTFATLAGLCSEILVLAQELPGTGPRKQLRLIRVPTAAAGVSLEELPATVFAPEIPHYRVRLADVRLPAAAVVPGDGWADFVRPFRTIEDTFVTLAALGYLVGVARRGRAQHSTIEALSACLAGALHVAGLPPSEATTHVALAGVLRQFREATTLLAPAFSRLEPAEQARWSRDLPLIFVAERARAARLEKAFSLLGLAQAAGSD